METATKTTGKTIDCTPSWESLVPYMLSVLEEPDHKEESKVIIREQIRKMAQVADKHVAHVKSQTVSSDNLLAKIIEIARPKYCGDTTILLNARAKIFGMKGDDAILNGLVGTCINPIQAPYSTKGMVGFYITAGQKKPFSDDTINIEAKYIQFMP